MRSFGKDNTLWMHTGSVMQVTCKFRFLSEQLHQSLFISIPVCYYMACDTTFYCAFCYGCTNFGNETRINWFWNKVFRSECKVIDMIYLIHNVRNRFLRQICDGVYCGQFHLLINCFRVYIKRSTEDIWESDDIVYLIRIIASSC